MSKKSKNSKKIKNIIIIVAVLLIIVLSIIVFKNLFSSSNSNRLEGMENYKLSNNEINSVKDKISELENVEKVDVYITDKTKIIKVLVNLKEDVDFEKVKSKSNEILSNFSKENLSFYDVEIFIKSANKESEIYPQIGYKHKNSEAFSW